MARKRVKIFRELQDSLRDALAYEQGEEVNLRVVELPPAPRKLRPRESRETR